MCFFENDYFLSILKAYKQVTFPMLVPVIVKIADDHWHSVLKESLVALRTILHELDKTAFNKEAERFSGTSKGSKDKESPYILIQDPVIIKDELNRLRL